jgi:hypothetical protein
MLLKCSGIGCLADLGLFHISGGLSNPSIAGNTKSLQRLCFVSNMDHIGFGLVAQVKISAFHHGRFLFVSRNGLLRKL